jgi:nicotinamide riboside transporter PnuC
MLIFGREPAQVLALFAAIVQLGSATIFHLTSEQQGVLNAAAVAVVGLITAAAVSADKAAAALSGLVQAVLAAALAFGAHLTPELQSSIMVFVSAGVAFWLRTQVTAPRDVNGQKVVTRGAQRVAA